MSGPGDQVSASEGRSHRDLRASHADRGRVIGTLKAAFVHGMLAKEEFDLRVGQALASRTYSELAAATADLPAIPIAAEPPKAAPAQGEPRIPRPGIVLTVATVVYAAVWPVVFLLPKDGEGDPQGGLALVTLTSFFYVILLLLVGTPILADWLNERW
ncbi:MAG TPA: DUF1707 domain-containing protein [Streptosporangiaceae bacterium]